MFIITVNIIKIHGDIPLDILSGSLLDIHKSNKRNIHNMCFYPAKFINELPRWAIKKYSTNKNDIILDPFCGSGTTFVESLYQGKKCLGIDNSPFARLIASVKGYPIKDIHNLKKVAMRILKQSKDVKYTEPLINFDALEFWFDNACIIALSKLRSVIDNIPDTVFKNFFLVVFASTVRKCSKLGDGQILTAKRSKYNDDKIWTQEEVYDCFLSYCNKYIDYMINFINELNLLNINNLYAEIISNDAKSLPNINVDLIVTSPPYINAIDYIWSSKLELHWLDMVKNNEDRLSLYSKEIGTERFPSHIYKEIGKTGVTSLDEQILDIFSGIKYKASGNQNKIRARTTYQYFIDMYKHFKEIYKVLKKGGHYCLVIGDSSNVCKVKIPTAKYLIEIAENIGFEKVFDFSIILKNRQLNIPRNVDWADVIKHDCMIVLQK